MTKCYALQKDVFDINKVTVVGSPTITSDGVASGFNSTNKVEVNNLQITPTNNFKVTGKCTYYKTGEVQQFCTFVNTGSTRFVLTEGGSITVYDSSMVVGLAQAEHRLEDGDEFVYSLEYNLKTNKVLLSVNSTSKSATYTLNMDMNKVNLSMLNNPFAGSIDLNAFKIYVDNELVYSPTKPTYYLERRKEGFDLSKFTIVGSPTITDDGVASGFSNSNYLTFPISVGNNSWEMVLKLNLTSISSSSDVFGSNSATSPSLALTVLNGRLTLSIGNGSTWQLTNIAGVSTLNINTDYFIKISYDTLKYKLQSSTDNQTWTNEAEYTSSTPIGITNLKLGVSRSGFGQLNGSIDLKQFSITVDGEEVFTGAKEKFYAMRRMG